jgi:1-phosphofructokinase
MVYTVTVNPALDLTVKLDDFKPGALNRAADEKIHAGGKGINVSYVLNSLGIKTRAVGFIAGFTGREIARLLLDAGIESDFIELKEGNSRINIKLNAGNETEINGKGPRIRGEDLNKLYDRLSSVSENDILVLSGSFGRDLPEDLYARIIGRIDKNAKVAVDTTRGLFETLKYRPFLIKPNRAELCALFNEKELDIDGVLRYAKKLQALGAQNVLVSLGADGALLLDEHGEIHTSPAPEGRAVNTVGAGDSMVAGFIAGHLMGKNHHDAFRLGLAAGSATAFCERFAAAEQIYMLHEKLEKTEN